MKVVVIVREKQRLDALFDRAKDWTGIPSYWLIASQYLVFWFLGSSRTRSRPFWQHTQRTTATDAWWISCNRDYGIFRMRRSGRFWSGWGALTRNGKTALRRISTSR